MTDETRYEYRVCADLVDHGVRPLNRDHHTQAAARRLLRDFAALLTEGESVWIERRAVGEWEKVPDDGWWQPMSDREKAFELLSAAGRLSGQRRADGSWGYRPDAGCRCSACNGRKTKHWSDCSVHNEPAYPNGPCDCGATNDE